MFTRNTVGVFPFGASDDVVVVGRRFGCVVVEVEELSLLSVQPTAAPSTKSATVTTIDFGSWRVIGQCWHMTRQAPSHRPVTTSCGDPLRQSQTKSPTRQ